MAFLGDQRECGPGVRGAVGALVAAILVLGASLGGCGTTSPWPEMTPAELVPTALMLRAETIYRAGPWAKTYAVVDKADRETGARQIRRCSAPGADGTWSIGTFEALNADTGQDTEERKLQTITLGASGDGGITLIVLEDVARATRTAFDPPLVILPGKLEVGVPVEAESEALVSSLSVPGVVVERGRARLRTVFSADPDDSETFRVRQTLKIELSSSVIERRTFLIGRRTAGITAENEELTVTAGPFTVMSKSRRLRLIQSAQEGVVR